MDKRISGWVPALLLLLAACGQPEGFRKPEDGLDAGREFIRAVLDGDYRKAEIYVLKEDEDMRLYDRYRGYMKTRPEKERLGLKSANILIHRVEPVSDSVTLINYSNSFSQKPTDLRIIKKNGEWWVDFSYTFSGGQPAEEPSK
jgi:hypothetical protein